MEPKLKALLWRWFAAERYREMWEGGIFDKLPNKIERTKEAINKANNALEAVLKMFEIYNKGDSND